jgi:hypothetical protein
MKKLGLIKVLGVFSIFCSSNVSFADPISKVFQEMSVLKGNVDPQHVDDFEKKVQNFIERLQNRLNVCNKKEKVQCTMAYLEDLIEIAKKVLEYQQNPTPQLQGELQAIARTYGGEVRELIWSLPPPAAAPAPALPQPVPAVAPVPAAAEDAGA